MPAPLDESLRKFVRACVVLLVFVSPATSVVIVMGRIDKLLVLLGLSATVLGITVIGFLWYLATLVVRIPRVSWAWVVLGLANAAMVLLLGFFTSWHLALVGFGWGAASPWLRSTPFPCELCAFGCGAAAITLAYCGLRSTLERQVS